MSNKPRANQIALNTTSFTRNLSIADNDLQKAFNTIDQLSTSASHNLLPGIQGGSLSDGYYHFTGPEHTWLLDGYTNNWSVSKGGTGISSYAAGDIIYASATNVLSKLPKSTDGYYLQLLSGLPSWQPVDTAGSISVDTSNFGVILSSADSTIQLALDTLDDHNHILGNDLSGTTLLDAYVVGIRDTSITTVNNWIEDGAFNYYGGVIRCVGLAGDLYGGITTAEVRGLYGRAISSNVPEDGYALIYNQGTGEWIPGVVSTDPPDLTLGNDLSGSLSDAYVVGFNGYPLETTQVPTDGQVFFYNGAQSKWWCSQINGDVSGSFESVTVDKIKNVEIDSSILSDGYALLYNLVQNKWIPGSVTIPSVTLGGDLSGILGDAYVVGIKGKTVDEIDAWDTNGIFNYSSGDVKVTAAGGDISGAIDNISVVGMNGIELDTTAPLDGYAYIYSSSLTKWVPTKINNSFTIIAGKQDLLTANSTSYVLANFAESSDETAIAFLAPVSGTISNLVCYCATAPGGSESVIITVRKNAADTTITGTISGSATTATDITNTVNLAAGDKITFKSVTSLNCVARDLFVSVVFTVPTINSAIVSGGGGGSSTGFGTFANMPAAGTNGAMYIANNSPTAMWVDSGSNWNPIIGGSIVGKRPPLASAFTSLSYSNQTLADSNGSLLYSTPNGGNSLVMRDFSIPFASATAFVDISFSFGVNAIAGIVIFGIHMIETSTQKALCCYTSGDGAGSVNYLEYGAFTSYTRSSFTYFPLKSTLLDSKLPVFIRIKRDSSNMVLLTSIDLINFDTIYTVATTSVFTTAPTHVGFFGIGYNTAAKAIITHFNYGSL